MRVLLADDQALVRGGFRLILDAEPDIDVVAEAGDGEEAVARAVETTPDLVLMDIRMPKLDGIEATRQLLVAARRDTRPDPDDVRPRRVRRRRLPRRSVRIPAQDRTTAPAGRGLPHRPRRRCPARARKHPPADRAVRPAAQRPDRPRGADRARAGRHSPACPRPDQRRDRRPTRRRALDRQIARRQPAHEARAARPRAGRRLRLRARNRSTRERLAPARASQRSRSAPSATVITTLPVFWPVSAYR